MGVEGECQAVVAYVLGAVAGLGHGTEGDVLECRAFGLALGVREEGVEGLRSTAALEAVAHLVSERACERPQPFKLRAVGHVMDAVDEGLKCLKVTWKHSNLN